jgi:hypothetical protein
LKALLCAIACGLRGLQARARACAADRRAGRTEGKCCANLLRARARGATPGTARSGYRGVQPGVQVEAELLLGGGAQLAEVMVVVRRSPCAPRSREQRLLSPPPPPMLAR